MGSSLEKLTFKLNQALLNIIKNGKYLKEYPEEEWDNIELLVQLKKLERKFRLGLISHYNYQKRRIKICGKIIKYN